MRIFIKVKPSARENKIEKLDEEHFVVSVKEPPVQGRANRAIINELANYFGISASSVTILSGHTSRNKIVKIEK